MKTFRPIPHLTRLAAMVAAGLLVAAGGALAKGNHDHGSDRGSDHQMKSHDSSDHGDKRSALKEVRKDKSKSSDMRSDKHKDKDSKHAEKMKAKEEKRAEKMKEKEAKQRREAAKKEKEAKQAEKTKDNGPQDDRHHHDRHGDHGRRGSGWQRHRRKEGARRPSQYRSRRPAAMTGPGAGQHDASHSCRRPRRRPGGPARASSGSPTARETRS